MSLTTQNELIEKIMKLNNKEFFVIKGDFRERGYESYETAILRLFENSEKVIATGDENPFEVFKKKMENRTIYLISNGLDEIYIIVRDDNEELEKKLLDAESELFTKIEELLNLNDKYQILDGALGVQLYYPDLRALDIVFDAEEQVDYVDFYGDEIKIKYAKEGDYAFIEIPYEEFYKIYEYVLENDYKRVEF